MPLPVLWEGASRGRSEVRSVRVQGEGVMRRALPLLLAAMFLAAACSSAKAFVISVILFIASVSKTVT